MKTNNNYVTFTRLKNKLLESFDNSSKLVEELIKIMNRKLTALETSTDEELEAKVLLCVNLQSKINQIAESLPRQVESLKQAELIIMKSAKDAEPLRGGDEKEASMDPDNDLEKEE